MQSVYYELKSAISCPIVKVVKAYLSLLLTAGSDADAEVSSGLRPGQCISRFRAHKKQGESLQSETAGIPGGPAETSGTCSEASDQGDHVNP